MSTVCLVVCVSADFYFLPCVKIKFYCHLPSSMLSSVTLAAQFADWLTLQQERGLHTLSIWLRLFASVHHLNCYKVYDSAKYAPLSAD